jgi:hypothetical protein
VSGERCPYHADAPTTLEGWQAWDLAERLSGQLRVGPAGHVYGFDLGAGMELAAALGLDRQAMAELLPALEAGMVAGFAQRRGTED